MEHGFSEIFKNFLYYSIGRHCVSILLNFSPVYPDCAYKIRVFECIGLLGVLCASLLQDKHIISSIQCRKSFA